MRSTGNGSLAGLVNELRTPPIVRVDPSPYQVHAQTIGMHSLPHTHMRSLPDKMLCQVDCTMRLHKIDSLMRMLKLNEVHIVIKFWPDYFYFWLLSYSVTYFIAVFVLIDGH